jgi:hypothetical protein
LFLNILLSPKLKEKVGTANYKSLKEIKGILFNFVGVKA